MVEGARRDPLEVAARAEDVEGAESSGDPDDRADRRSRERQARREAKLEARRARASAREAAAASRVEKVSATPVVVEVEPETDPGPDPEPEAAPQPEPEPKPDPEPLAEVLARHGAFDRPRAVVAQPAEPSEPADVLDDGIVEAPREPRKSLGDRLRSAVGPRSGRAEPGASTPPKGSAKGAGSGGRTRRVVVVLAGLVGAAGLVGSVVLALGALLVALDATDSSLFDTVSSTCDALVGPLADAFSFSGTNAAMKESLVAWGAGAILYLVVGMVAQSLLRSTVDD